MRVLVLLAAFAAIANADPKKLPERCLASFFVGSAPSSSVARGSITGAVTKLAFRDGSWRFVIDKQEFGLGLGLVDKPPFARGDRVTVGYDCIGFATLCNAHVDDASGKPLVIISAGADSSGWTSKVGDVVSSRQDPNQSAQSVEAYHELVLGKDRRSFAVRGDTCTAIADGGTSWLAAGIARTWVGARPPEGIDYRTYSLIRSSP